MHNGSSNNLYYTLEGFKTMLIPMRANIEILEQWFKNSNNPVKNSGYAHVMLAYLTLAERMTRTYKKPKFNINECIINGTSYVVKEKTVATKTFCQLKHFSKIGIKQKSMPKLLIIAPMSGHHATLLRDTVTEMLPYADVYITDWLDASTIPNQLGKFNLDDFIDYLIEFMTLLGPNLHTMAVCQPTVPLLAAISIMSANNDVNVPRSMTLIGGPIDARLNPTDVDLFAIHKSMQWFCQMVITSVPFNYPGYGRNVYPGFLQLMGFISLNIPRHINSHLDLLQNLLDGNLEKANHTIKFYDEYLATMDITSEFYLQTIQEVFKDFALAKDEFVSKNRKVHLKNITKCALLGIEGENDDIAAVGQTKTALDLCSGIPMTMKKYHLQKGVGHYGLFSGSKFKQFIVPIIRDFIYSCQN
ncbi:polyhydroxyalkanoate depolymerase [Candidatus Tisiphia endosymbiont of Thecophora atra]|uniref:polyhydroxyalkanoate depolymerase n=1 Tax=Candidatus Tisiphia endosymbiont of Thecophora atra TaxID=3066258 RepID=UPI00312CB04C